MSFAIVAFAHSTWSAGWLSLGTLILYYPRKDDRNPNARSSDPNTATPIFSHRVRFMRWLKASSRPLGSAERWTIAIVDILTALSALNLGRIPVTLQFIVSPIIISPGILPASSWVVRQKWITMIATSVVFVALRELQRLVICDALQPPAEPIRTHRIYGRVSTPVDHESPCPICYDDTDVGTKHRVCSHSPGKHLMHLPCYKKWLRHSYTNRSSGERGPGALQIYCSPATENEETKRQVVVEAKKILADLDMDYLTVPPPQGIPLSSNYPKLTLYREDFFLSNSQRVSAVFVDSSTPCPVCRSPAKFYIVPATPGLAYRVAARMKRIRSSFPFVITGMTVLRGITMQFVPLFMIAAYGHHVVSERIRVSRLLNICSAPI